MVTRGHNLEMAHQTQPRGKFPRLCVDFFHGQGALSLRRMKLDEDGRCEKIDTETGGEKTDVLGKIGGKGNKANEFSHFPAFYSPSRAFRAFLRRKFSRKILLHFWRGKFRNIERFQLFRATVDNFRLFFGLWSNLTRACAGKKPSRVYVRSRGPRP